MPWPNNSRPDWAPTSCPYTRPRSAGMETRTRGVSAPGTSAAEVSSWRPPKTRPIAQTEMEFYRRKQSLIAVRHVSGDRVVAVVEVVSPGNKSTRNALEDFVRKAADFLNRRVHLLILDLLPPGRHDPRGIHGAIRDYIDGQDYSPPPGKPLTLAAYESDLVTQAYVEPVAVGDALPDMPLFLERDGCVYVPLEDSYRSAWEAVPRRWKVVLEPPR